MSGILILHEVNRITEAVKARNFAEAAAGVVLSATARTRANLEVLKELRPFRRNQRLLSAVEAELQTVSPVDHRIAVAALASSGW